MYKRRGRAGERGKVSRDAIVQGFRVFGQQGGESERGHHNEYSTSFRAVTFGSISHSSGALSWTGRL